MNKEGYFNHKTNTFVHITKDCVMDCNPKSYKYILRLEKEILRLNNEKEDLQKRFNFLMEAHKICDELETEFQERNEKAIEYCKLNKEFTPRLEDVENILNGGDKDVKDR